MTRTRLLLLLPAALPLLLGSCGSFSHAMKADDKARSLRRPLIISMINDHLAFRVLFEREKIPVPEWRVNETLQDALAARLRAQGIQPRTADASLRHAARTFTWLTATDNTSDLKFAAFIRQNAARLGDADSVIFIHGHPGKNMFDTVGGIPAPPSVAWNPHQSLIIYGGTARVSIYTVEGARQLSWAHGNDSGTEHLEGAWGFRHWKDATPATQAQMRDRLLRILRTSLNEAATRAGL